LRDEAAALALVCLFAPSGFTTVGYPLRQTTGKIEWDGKGFSEIAVSGRAGQ